MYSAVQQILLMVLPVLLAVTVHEVAHGWMALRLGDPTAKLLGRLTLNPLKHLDPVGTLVFFLTRTIGWAKPVPINPFNFRDPRRDMAFVALAGPLANIALALLSALVYRGLLLGGLVDWFEPLFLPLSLMLKMAVIVNLGLALFNLIPVPPLDGSRILMGFLPRREARALASLEPYGFIILVGLILLGVVRAVVYPVLYSLFGLFTGHPL